MDDLEGMRHEWWRDPWWQDVLLPEFRKVPRHGLSSCAVCGRAAQGWVRQQPGVPEHWCKHCRFHCPIVKIYRQRKR